MSDEMTDRKATQAKQKENFHRKSTGKYGQMGTGPDGQGHGGHEWVIHQNDLEVLLNRLAKQPFVAKHPKRYFRGLTSGVFTQWEN